MDNLVKSYGYFTEVGNMLIKIEKDEKNLNTSTDPDVVVPAILIGGMAAIGIGTFVLYILGF